LFLCCREEDDDVDLKIIDEFLIDSKDTVTHTPKGVILGDVSNGYTYYVPAVLYKQHCNIGLAGCTV